MKAAMQVGYIFNLPLVKAAGARKAQKGDGKRNSPGNEKGEPSFTVNNGEGWSIQWLVFNADM